MPRYEFWFSDKDAISWAFEREPEIGEEVVLGDRGVFRITGVRAAPLRPEVIEFACAPVRPSTDADVEAHLMRGLDQLPPRDT